MPELDPDKLIVIDESGFPLNLAPKYARCNKGDRIKMPAPIRGKNISAIGAINNAGIIDIALIEGSIDQDCVESFIEFSLLPKINPGDILLIDNAPVHNLKKINELLATKNSVALPLPRYSPDLSPIEMLWSKLKDIIRKIKPRTEGELFEAFIDAANNIDEDDCKNWYEHCGYVAA